MIDSNGSDILKWIQKDPETNRRKLCEKFENDNEVAYDFVIERPVYQNFVKNFITDSHWAYWWALHIGNEDFMKYKITESKFAYHWTRNIGNKDFMKHRVNESSWAYWWTRDIGDREFMKHKITESKWAYKWAQQIGNQNEMKQVVKQNSEQKWVDKWNTEFNDSVIYTLKTKTEET